MNKEPKPLYRKVNTKARGVYHHKGSHARYDRNTKAGISRRLSQGKQRGLDYTPLYRFLHSKVGQDWDTIYSEAIKRLPSPEPIWHIVMDLSNEEIPEHRRFGYVLSGDSGIFQTLFIDEDGKLQLIKPDLKNEDFGPTCPCCTHTFNGEPLTRKYDSASIGYTPAE